MLTRHIGGVTSSKAWQVCHIMVHIAATIWEHIDIQFIFFEKTMKNTMILPWSWEWITENTVIIPWSCYESRRPCHETWFPCHHHSMIMTIFRHDHGMIMKRSCHDSHVFPTRGDRTGEVKFGLKFKSLPIRGT